MLEKNMIEGGLTIAHDKRSLRGHVIATIRRAILSGRFVPGERLTEKRLCALLDVSRASVREALQHLVAEGLIENVPHRGPVVASMSQKEAADIYEVREILETMACAEFAQNATESQIARLEQALTALKDPKMQTVKKDQVISGKNHFYEVLFEGCGNRVMEQLLVALNNRVALLRRVSLSKKGRFTKSVRELDAIVAAIRRRNVDAACAACQRHVRNAAEAALAQLPKTPTNDNSNNKAEGHRMAHPAAPKVLAALRTMKHFVK